MNIVCSVLLLNWESRFEFFPKRFLGVCLSKCVYFGEWCKTLFVGVLRLSRKTCPGLRTLDPGGQRGPFKRFCVPQFGEWWIS